MTKVLIRQKVFKDTVLKLVEYSFETKDFPIEDTVSNEKGDYFIVISTELYDNILLQLRIARSITLEQLEDSIDEYYDPNIQDRDIRIYIEELSEITLLIELWKGER